MKIPNPDQAVVDITKIRDYCLNPNHAYGRHKARVFASALGITRTDADVLRTALLRAAVQEEASTGLREAYGQRYVVDFSMKGPLGVAKVRTSWIVLTGENFARLTSCYVL